MFSCFQQSAALINLDRFQPRFIRCQLVGLPVMCAFDLK